jgi:predicted DNA-binding protein (UPF0251 family)
MSRPSKCKIVNICLEHNEFVSNSKTDIDVIITAEELQAIKLKDLDNCGCIDGAEKM